MPSNGDDLRVSRIASLTLANAMIFQQILAERDTSIRSLGPIISGSDIAEKLEDAWHAILTIDYFPIFKLATEILSELSGNAGIDEVLRGLGKVALRITRKRAALRHDLMGRIYHRLLADAKYFGAFYTTVSAATLLLKLTLDPYHSGTDWSAISDIAQLRIADLACGTGTLLKAALEAVVDNHVHARARKGLLPELHSVHGALVENGLWGLDVIPFAIHLAASALAMHEPDVRFQNMRLYTLPLSAGARPRLGSIELIAGRTIPLQADLFGATAGASRMTGSGTVIDRVDIPPLDLCVMNPPFTRSVGGNLLFGNLPARERAQLQSELKKIVRTRDVAANITAGLGSVFAAIGEALVKRRGHLSLVLPRALLSGVAWEATRQLIGANYHVRYVIVSHQPGRWNFSENTALSECMIVARKLGKSEEADPTKFVNLWDKPESSIAALTVAELSARTDGAFLDRTTGTEELVVDGRKFGELVLAPAEQMRKGVWNEEAAFAQTELSRTAFYIRRGGLYIPGCKFVEKIPIVPLGNLGTLGPDRRDIHDAFKLSVSATSYPALWGHDTQSVQQIKQDPNRYLVPLTRPQKGRHLRDPNLLWSRAGRLLIAERLRLNTARAFAVRMREPVLSNTWWPVAIPGYKDIDGKDAERVLALWFNSTFGAISLIASRVDTQGPWIDLKKPMLDALPVMNPYALGSRQRKKLVDAYKEHCPKKLAPLAEIESDRVRSAIDEAIIDAVSANADSKILRFLLAKEPIIMGA